MYIEKEKNYLVYHTEKETFRIRGTIADAEEALKNEGFSKCISGCLINLKYVTRVSQLFLAESFFYFHGSEKSLFALSFGMKHNAVRETVIEFAQDIQKANRRGFHFNIF